MSQCSDTDSSSELGTPEYSLPSWPSAVVVDTPSTLPALQATDSSPQHAFKQSQRDTTRINTSPLESSVNMMAPPRELDAASLQLDRLAIQRPARLERLSSAATTATARPSSPSDDSPAPTATQSPRHSQASDRSSLSLSSRTILSKPFSLDSNVPIGANPSSPSDAWRSLLPKTDPYFAPDSQPRSSQQFERPASPQCLPSTSSTFDIDAYAAAKSSPRASTIDRMSTSSLGTSRTSFSSITSGFSAMSMSSVNNQLSRQSHDSVRSDSWTSFLPEGDRYLTSRNADVSASQIAASPSLESPSLSDRLDSPTSSDSDDHRSAFLALKTPRSNEGASSSDSDSAARRHASFSSVESDTVKQRGATRAVPAIVRDGARPFAKSASQSFERTALPYASSSSSSSSAGVMSPPSRDSFDAPRISSELSSSKLEDDTSERDSWPTSRVDRSGCLGTSSTGSSDRSTPETSSSLETLPTPKDKSSLATVPPRVVETSDSTVPASQADLPATTTTTPTITKKFTTTTGAQPLLDVEASRASNKARSEADVDVGPKVVEKGDDKLQCSSTKARASSCSISTPVSSMDHPFLDRRPAPSGTNLVIEQERFRYVVLVSLPGFSLDCITVATKRNAKQYTLHVVADKYDAEGGGHFERRVTFSEKDCDMVGVRSEFDGNTLRVIVPRILSSSRSSSANSARF